jgi:hypothetical protein
VVRQPDGAQARDERGQSSPPGERPGPTTTAGAAGQNEEQGMIFRITINGDYSYIAIGNRDALMDAAYDSGAEGVSIIEVRS